MRDLPHGRKAKGEAMTKLICDVCYDIAGEAHSAGDDGAPCMSRIRGERCSGHYRAVEEPAETEGATKCERCETVWINDWCRNCGYGSPAEREQRERVAFVTEISRRGDIERGQLVSYEKHLKAELVALKADLAEQRERAERETKRCDALIREHSEHTIECFAERDALKVELEQAEQERDLLRDALKSARCPVCRTLHSAHIIMPITARKRETK